MMLTGTRRIGLAVGIMAGWVLAPGRAQAGGGRFLLAPVRELVVWAEGGREINSYDVDTGQYSCLTSSRERKTFSRIEDNVLAWTQWTHGSPADGPLALDRYRLLWCENPGGQAEMVIFTAMIPEPATLALLSFAGSAALR